MTALVAEAFFGQGFFRTLLFLGIAFLWGFALYDLARSRSHGWAKAIWLLVIILLPVLGSLIYLASRPSYAIETDPTVNAEFQGREREEMAVESTHRSMS
jgi:hypothetical protein